MKPLLSRVLTLTVIILSCCDVLSAREKFNFNEGWLLKLGDSNGSELVRADDSRWMSVSLPRAWNEDEAFRLPCHDLSDSVVWYRKHFNLDNIIHRKFFIEFEGVKWAADVYINGHKLGISENGVMAFGFDLTPYVKSGENVIAVRVDNSWNYRERATNQRYQWNDKNFNANYGGIPKNVFLYSSDLLYQTLPLYSNLNTIGTYIYGSDYDIAGRKVKVNVESQVRNEDSIPRSFRFSANVIDREGNKVGYFEGERYTLQPGETRILKVNGNISNAHFWSWGYGYLYTINSVLKADDGSEIDNVATRTGFRKTRFAEGKVWLNDRVISMHGYAQRTSNEWPGVGMSVPAWLSDYSNKLQVESGGNLVRWMHVTPWKQDVESCDRVGLIESMPAGDSEHDVTGRRWEQRSMLMRDAIIYNRNNPSILFYEGGNESISREHMIELKAIRDEYDPYGGRAMGSREMLDIDEAEYGGEMLYVNKSRKHPMWMMEYYRDEGLRKYWDEYSYPYHKEGDGPLYRNAAAPDYNHNMDMFAVGQVKSWYDYYLERPGTGSRVNAGGAKIVFSDTNTHWRGEANFRTSGVTDAMRIPKDAFYAMQVMWDGWVTPENNHTYIVGHWNYNAGTVKPVYVISNGTSVDLLLNGKKIATGINSYRYLFTFDHLAYEPGKLEAVSYDSNRHELSRYSVETVGKPHHLKLTTIQNPLGFKADGADMALIQVEVVDSVGRRCPLDNRMIHWNQYGEGEWIGGIAASTEKGNYIHQINVPVECGVGRVLVRSTANAGNIYLCVGADGLPMESDTLKTIPVENKDGLGKYIPSFMLHGNLDRGETPSTPSYKDLKNEIDIVSANAGSNIDSVKKSFDDNELSEWSSDGKPDNAWITYNLAHKAAIDEITIKLTGWRSKCYPLAIYEGNKKVWQGSTYPTLGYVHINIPRPLKSNKVTVKMLGPAIDSSKYGEIKELAGGKTNELDFAPSKKDDIKLRIVEVDFLQSIK